LSLVIFSCEKEEENLKTGQVKFKTYPSEEEKKVCLELVAQKLTIDWGDGNIEHFSPNGEYQGFTHQYDTWSLKTIQITADGMTHFGKSILDEEDIKSQEKHFDELIFGYCPELQEINCSYMGLIILEINKAESLTTLDCTFNKLLQLDLNGCPSLTNLYCMNNKLITLTINKCTVLKNLWCLNNQLTALELDANKTLTMLICGNNRINNLDLNNYKSLQHLVCNYTNIFYRSSNIYYIRSGKYLFRKQYFTNSRSLLKSADDGIGAIIDYENKTKNPPLSHINLTGCNALISMSCENNQVTTIDMSDCVSLEYLSLKYNELTSNALNTIFESLPMNNTNNAEIYIKGNQGVSDCDEGIAINKGWKIDK
jgi:hypothetical protein